MADGLFSYQTPGQLQQEYLSNLIQPVGGGNLYSQLVQTMSNAGRMMGYGAGRMFGGQVPGEAKNAAIQSVFEQVKDIQDPTQQYTAASQLFLKAGFPDLAMQARKTAQTEQLAGLQLRKSTAEVKELEDKPARLLREQGEREAMLVRVGATPENAKVFSKSPEISSAIIKDAMKPKEGVKLTSEQALAAKESGLPVLSSIDSYTPAQAGEIRKRVLAAKQKVAEAGSTKALNAYASEVGKLTAQEDVKLIADVRKAPAAVSKLRETLEILHKSDDELTTGLGADVRNLINKAKAQFLNDEKAGKDVKNTEYLRALLGSDVFAAIGAFGIGARGLDTPAERDFLLDVVAGRIGLNRGTLIKMTQFRLEAAEKGITDFNSRFDAGDFNKYTETTGRKLNKVVLPEWAPPVLPAKPGQPAPSGAGWSIKKKAN